MIPGLLTRRDKTFFHYWLVLIYIKGSRHRCFFTTSSFEVLNESIQGLDQVDQVPRGQRATGQQVGLTGWVIMDMLPLRTVSMSRHVLLSRVTAQIHPSPLIQTHNLVGWCQRETATGDSFQETSNGSFHASLLGESLSSYHSTLTPVPFLKTSSHCASGFIILY